MSINETHPIEVELEIPQEPAIRTTCNYQRGTSDNSLVHNKGYVPRHRSDQVPLCLKVATDELQSSGSESEDEFNTFDKEIYYAFKNGDVQIMPFTEA